MSAMDELNVATTTAGLGLDTVLVYLLFRLGGLLVTIGQAVRDLAAGTLRRWEKDAATKAEALVAVKAAAEHWIATRRRDAAA